MDKNYKKFFKDKKITLMGLGLLGRGIGDAKFLAKYAKELVITDLKTEEELASSIKEISELKNIKLVLGRHDYKDFLDTDMVIKAAGVPIDSPFIEHASVNNVPVHMSTALFAKFLKEDFGGKIIGVTGTRGKTTVSQLVYHTLKQNVSNVYIGGNIQGLSTLPLLENIEQGSVAVLELDSWQLQGFGYEKISPDISIFTSFFKDHLNYYKENLSSYFRDKANIFLYQKDSDCLIIGEQTKQAIQEYYKEPFIQRVIEAHKDIVPKDWQIKIIGEHNLFNISCAIETLKCIGLDIEKIRIGVESFRGVKGRLEFLGEKDGIKIYNDNNATTPEATIAALKALSNNSRERNIILIAGGSDKTLELKDLCENIKKYSKETLLLAGSGTSKLVELMPKITNEEPFDSLEEAFSVATKEAHAGDTILFSPAFASFGMFKNEYDRSDKFESLANNFLKEK